MSLAKKLVGIIVSYQHAMKTRKIISGSIASLQKHREEQGWGWGKMNMPKISVIVVTYRRLSKLEEILQAWLLQTQDVWLADSSNKFETELPINHVRFSPDPGNKTWHAIALLTEGDFVVKACDDVLPKPGFLDDLIKGWQTVKGGMVGIYGKKFLGPNYYKDTIPIIANRISSPQKADFIGNTTLTPRQYLAFDLKGCLSPVEDLFWHVKAFPGVPKWIIPTRRYVNLPESQDKDCIFFNKTAREIRGKFYREYYLKNYSKEQK